MCNSNKIGPSSVSHLKYHLSTMTHLTFRKPWKPYGYLTIERCGLHNVSVSCSKTPKKSSTSCGNRSDLSDSQDPTSFPFSCSFPSYSISHCSLVLLVAFLSIVPLHQLNGSSLGPTPFFFLGAGKGEHQYVNVYNLIIVSLSSEEKQQQSFPPATIYGEIVAG